MSILSKNERQGDCSVPGKKWSPTSLQFERDRKDNTSTVETQATNATYADIWTRLVLIDTRNFTTLIFPSTSILGFNLDLHLGQGVSDKKRIITATIE